jgi:long-chain acyl-CoA synthetase
MNIGKLIDQNIERYGEYESLFFEGQWYTNTELAKMGNRLANALKALGVSKGDRVATQVPNCPHLFWAFNAIYRLGAIVVPISPLLRPDQSAHIYRDSGACATLTSTDYLPMVLEAQRQAPSLKHVITIEKSNIPHVFSHDEIISGQSEHCQITDTDNDDVAALIYTAGTTGEAKGVMHTHFGFYACSLDFLHTIEQNSSVKIKISFSGKDARSNSVIAFDMGAASLPLGMVSLHVLPLSHIYGLAMVNMSTLTSGKSVVMKWWNPEQALKYIEQFKVTSISLVPTMYIQMLDHPDFSKYNLTSLTSCSSGGAPLPPDVGRRWKEKVWLDLSNGWGMTETGAVSTGQPYGKPVKAGSVGKCYLNCTSIKVFDDNDNELPPGRTGELVVRGPCVMKGYWQRPEQTAEALRNGWMHSGDVGHMDEDGDFYITDRKKDIIIRGGENVSPKEVEHTMLELPQLADAGVIGVPDNVYGEEIAAFCVLQQGQNIGAEEIISYCKSKLPGYKVPKSVRFVDALPRNPLGKLLRAELRRTFGCKAE